MMRSYKRYDSKRGFTLVELMIVVAIIGVLAALAIYGVRRYLASAKTSEAKNTVGAITRAAVSAHERENVPSALLTDGESGDASTRGLCGAAVAVPAAVPAGVKYQPQSGANLDFNLGDDTNGWVCLKFSVSQPIQYQYHYVRETTVVAGSPAGTAARWFQAAAVGDTDNDGVFSGFARTGEERNGEIALATEVFTAAEFE